MTGTDVKFTVEENLVEVGGIVRCHVKRSPQDGVDNAEGRGQVRGVKVGLLASTSGRGREDTKHFSTVELPVDSYGAIDQVVDIPVPEDAPISYSGKWIKVSWRVAVQTDVKGKRDDVSTSRLVVIPKGGTGKYTGPHPL